MKILPNGSVELEKGEYIPFVCPKCDWPIEYDPKVVMVNCFHCGYVGETEEFGRPYKIRK